MLQEKIYSRTIFSVLGKNNFYVEQKERKFDLGGNQEVRAWLSPSLISCLTTAAQIQTRRRRNLKDFILTNPDQEKKKSQKICIDKSRPGEEEISKISYLRIQTRRRRNLKDFILTYKSRLTEVSYF